MATGLYESGSAFTRRRAIALAAIFGLTAGFAPGCSQAPPSASSREPLEPSLAEQVEAVRQGQSNLLRLDRRPVGDDDLRRLDGLEDKLERINFSRTDITDAGLERISRMPLLVQLRLASARIDDAGLACLANLKHLRYLHLINVPISDAGLKHLHRLTSLESLYLDYIPASEDAKGRLAAALPHVHVHFDHEHHRLDPRTAVHKHADDHDHLDAHEHGDASEPQPGN